MARGRTSAITITLTTADVAQCLHWSRQTSIPQQLARAAQVLLARARGDSITTIALAVGLSRAHVYKWLRRYQAQGMVGLQRKRGSGTPRAAEGTPS